MYLTRISAGSAKRPSSMIDLGSASIDLGCSSLVVAGTLSLGAGFGIDNARDVTISNGGVLNGEMAALSVTGDWTKDAGGSFNAGVGTVSF